MATDLEPSSGSSVHVCEAGPAWRVGGHLFYGGRCWGFTCSFRFQINDLFSFP